MSDMMGHVLRMPFDLAMQTELSRRQYWDRAQEAMDEIERLRNGSIFMKQAAELTRLRATIETLRGTIEDLTADFDRDRKEIERLRAEVERLRLSLRLRNLRERAIAGGMKLLSSDEIDEEVNKRRQRA